MSLDKIREVLANLHGARAVSIVAETVPDLIPLGRQFKGRLVNRSYVNGLVNWAYERSVNNQRVREEKKPNFDAVERRNNLCRLQLPTRLLPFCAHKKTIGNVENVPDWHVITSLSDLPPADKLYLELKIQQSIDFKLILDGVEVIDPEQHAHLLSFIRQPNLAGRQGLDNPVILRDYKLSNLKSLTINGETINVE